MKLKPTYLVAVFTLGMSVFAPLSSAHGMVVVDDGNRIENPSVEIASGDGTPSAWSQGGWGTMSTDFRYMDGGQDGKKSLFLKVSGYVDGDAKWYFQPVSVQPSTSYVYSDYYIATSTSYVVTQYELTDGTYSYSELGTLAVRPGIGAWQRAAYKFVTPANVKNMTVFHLLRGNGTLRTDTFSLKKATQPEITGNVPNASLEQVDDVNTGLPLAWAYGSWGTNRPTFTYLKTGYAGSRSVRVDLTGYVDGDAKWYYEPQTVTPGQYYRFRDHYRSNVETQAVAAVILTDGTTQYINLGDVAASSGWALFSAGFTAPANAKTATVFHLIAKAGYLITDSYSVTPMAGAYFNRPVVSMTFDDGWLTNYSTVLPLLKKYNVPSTQYVVSDLIGTTGYMTGAQIQEMSQSGSEIGSHGQTHTELTTLTNGQLLKELSQSQKTISALIGKPVTDFAIPYGSYNANVFAGIKKYYAASRTSDTGYNTLDNLNQYNIRVQVVDASTTPEQVKAWTDQAVSSKSWLVLLYHQVDVSGSTYSTTPTQFEQNLVDITASGATVETVSQALQELAPQL